MANAKLEKRHKCADGFVEYYSHASGTTQTAMRFAIYLPERSTREKLPVLYWLSGLTCSEENFMVKAGAQRFAAQHGVILVAPDTSPRGAGIAGEDDSWDFGTGAGFYVDATQMPWAKNYRMYDYVASELPALIEARFPVRQDRRSIAGHSMGGHGALVVALRNPSRYRSVSAFSPICAPSQCAWGEKAFGNYLGTERDAWLAYDSVALVGRARVKLPILVDQGTGDEFVNTQLKPELLIKACRDHDYPLDFRWREAYDHSYYFISTFIGDHIAYHAAALRG